MEVIANTASPDETKQVATLLARCLQSNDVVVLGGELGAGKTQFVQGVADALGVVEDVVSPTFNIVLTHEGESRTLHHFDLYRLEEARDLEDIGFFEIIEDGGVSLVEWGAKFLDEFPSDYMNVQLLRPETWEHSQDEQRIIVAEGVGTRGEALLKEWLAALSS